AVQGDGNVVNANSLYYAPVGSVVGVGEADGYDGGALRRGINRWSDRDLDYVFLPGSTDGLIVSGELAWIFGRFRAGVHQRYAALTALQVSCLKLNAEELPAAGQLGGHPDRVAAKVG